ncbi:hypothetical protein KC364_g73 [Hortaea werneckii]|nr:hypothetical protein KC364_g73 [Hortaea werneckii]
MISIVIAKCQMAAVICRNVRGACAASGVFSRSAEAAEAISQAAFALCRFLILADSRSGGSMISAKLTAELLPIK